MVEKIHFSEFLKPGSIYRGIPFWAWNGKLDPEELRRQIRIMKQMGLGGFFMHSRIGLATEYLSEEWFECIKSCVDEAEKNGINAWLYDEDRWPSGAAGGKVTVDHQYRQKLLILKEIDDVNGFEPGDSTVAVFAVSEANGVFINSRRLDPGFSPEAINDNDKVFEFYVRTAANDDWFNGQAYLDTLSVEAVKKFIDVTHEKYKQEVGKDFGGPVPGIFTDEPRYSYAFLEQEDGCSIAWSTELLKVFKERYGYDLADHLPELFFDIPGETPLKARYHYFDCVTFMFVRAFAKQVGDWCEANNLMFTGHLMNEDTLSAQASCVGSCMRFYEYMQIPGMDLLTEHFRVYDTAKQVSSAARQFDRKWRLTETYGCTGWDFNFAGHKALGDWQVALGINMRAQHLSWYTMQGEAKRDYPASILHQSPWWEVYSEIENYFARLNLIMSEGREVRDLLVIHPNESMWLKLKRNWTNDPEINAYNAKLIKLRDSLLKQHLDFDYGDEDILRRYGKVIRNDNAEAILTLGAAQYKAVLVPELATIRGTTLELLKEFKARGGMVVFTSSAPLLVDGVKSNAAWTLAQECINISDGANEHDLNAIFGKQVRRVSITDQNGSEITRILYQLRETEDYYSLFVCNTGHMSDDYGDSNWDEFKVMDRQATFGRVTIKLCGESADVPLELNPDSGAICRIERAEFADGAINTSLQPLESRIFVFPKVYGLSKQYQPEKLYQLERSTKFGNHACKVELSEDNVLVLDQPEYAVNDGAWHEAEEILKIDYKVREFMKLPQRAARGKQPWAQDKSGEKVAAKVKLNYTFMVKQLPEVVFLATENPNCFTIELNGKPVDAGRNCGWWHDVSMRKLELDKNMLVKGENRLSMSCEYTGDFSGLESVYLLGDFGVDIINGKPEITAPVQTLELGDWTKQGLPFYAGAVKYRYYLCWINNPARKIFVKIPEFHGAAVRISVGNQVAGIICCNYKEIDISRFIMTGPNEVIIEVFGHCRNSHGPLHLNSERLHFITPEDFIIKGEKWDDDYILVSCGLIKAPLLNIRTLEYKDDSKKKRTINKKENEKWNRKSKVTETEFLRL